MINYCFNEVSVSYSGKVKSIFDSIFPGCIKPITLSIEEIPTVRSIKAGGKETDHSNLHYRICKVELLSYDVHPPKEATPLLHDVLAE